MERNETAVLSRGTCPSCGGEKKLVRYVDGRAHCFGSGCGYRERATEIDPTKPTPPPRNPFMHADMIPGEAKPLPKRALTQATCERWQYLIGNDEGTPVQLAHYRDPLTGTVVAQKVRAARAADRWIGDRDSAPLFGQHLWRDRGKMLVVADSEIDALSVSQAQEHKWPVVSVKAAATARADLAAQLEWLLGFETVVLLFSDTEAAIDCATLFPAGRCKLGRIDGHSGPNEALVAGKAGSIVDAIWSAREYRPDGIVTLAEVADRAGQTPPRGRPWFLPELDELTLGLRFGELVLVGGGSGTGKTHFALHQAELDLRNGYPVGLHLMEADPESSVRTLAGIRAGRNYTEVAESTNLQQLRDDIASFTQPGAPPVYLLDSQGSNEWAAIRDRIRSLTHASGVRIHYVDNLTTMAAASEFDEKEAVEQIVSEAANLCTELDINIILVSHLSTPDGTPHEEGGRVMLRHFRGSRAVGYWSWIVVGLERNSQAPDDEVRLKTCARLLKCRPRGSSTGKTAWMAYSPDTAKLTPTTEPPKAEKASRHGFRDENGDF